MSRYTRNVSDQQSSWGFLIATVMRPAWLWCLFTGVALSAVAYLAPSGPPWLTWVDRAGVGTAGLIACVFTWRQWTSMPAERRDHYRPHTRWPDAKQRQRAISVAAIIWLGTLVVAFLLLPTFLRPLIGIPNVVIVFAALSLLIPVKQLPVVGGTDADPWQAWRRDKAPMNRPPQ